MNTALDIAFEDLAVEDPDEQICEAVSGCSKLALWRILFSFDCHPMRLYCTEHKDWTLAIESRRPFVIWVCPFDPDSIGFFRSCTPLRRAE